MKTWKYQVLLTWFPKNLCSGLPALTSYDYHAIFPSLHCNLAQFMRRHKNCRPQFFLSGDGCEDGAGRKEGRKEGRQEPKVSCIYDIKFNAKICLPFSNPYQDVEFVQPAQFHVSNRPLLIVDVKHACPLA